MQCGWRGRDLHVAFSRLSVLRLIVFHLVITLHKVNKMSLPLNGVRLLVPPLAISIAVLYIFNVHSYCKEKRKRCQDIL